MRKNFFYNSVLTVSGMVMPLITFPYITRILGPENFGLVNFVISFVQYFVLIAALGVPFYGVREIAKVKDDINKRSKVFIEIILVRLFFSVVAILFYFLIIFYIPKCKDNILLFFWGGFQIIIGVFEINWFFSGIENFKYISIRTVLFQALQVVAIFIFINHRDDALIYILITIFISALNAGVNIAYVTKKVVFNLDISPASIKKHFKPLFLIFSSIFFISVYNLLDAIILGFLSSDQNVGFYSAASRISKVPLALIGGLAPVVIPRISRAINENRIDEIIIIEKKTLHFVSVIGVPIMTGLIAIAPEIVLALSGIEFTPSIRTLQIMAPLGLIIGLTMNFSTQLLIPFGEEKRLLYIVIFGTLISLCGNYLLIPLLKHNGAATVNLMVEIIILILCYFTAKKLISIHIPYKLLFINFLFTIPFFLFAELIRDVTNILTYRLLFSTILSATYYLCIQYYIKKDFLFIEATNLCVRTVVKAFEIKSRK